ncbi:MAG: hypothetical protein MUE60_15940 [Candidatus Eisenbacteria bacterium]|jgi:hypothetical protein|nr:hypothetical protein [Candidatus Eisenbacteria bacterium]
MSRIVAACSLCGEDFDTKGKYSQCYRCKVGETPEARVAQMKERIKSTRDVIGAVAAIEARKREIAKLRRGRSK